jgi:multidrug efflux pump subunit AcrB
MLVVSGNGSFVTASGDEVPRPPRHRIRSWSTRAGDRLLGAQRASTGGGRSGSPRGAASFSISLKEWDERKAPDEQYKAIIDHVNAEFSTIAGAHAMAFGPPAIPEIGPSAGVTFMLQDRAGKDVMFRGEQVMKFITAASQRKELAGAIPLFSPAVPQVFVNVDREKVLKQMVPLSAVTKR